mmetsp:Transcript_18503/g.17824  ORF Transcript_18503/g.17824 Transcript_18503/m.17824 type:complete len:97 (+) Transcript_18503:81-371(+)
MDKNIPEFNSEENEYVQIDVKSSHGSSNSENEGKLNCIDCNIILVLNEEIENDQKVKLNKICTEDTNGDLNIFKLTKYASTTRRIIDQHSNDSISA